MYYFCGNLANVDSAMVRWGSHVNLGIGLRGFSTIKKQPRHRLTIGHVFRGILPMETANVLAVNRDEAHSCIRITGGDNVMAPGVSAT